MNMTHHKSGLRWLWLAVLAFVLDQASKLAVVKLLPFGYPGVEITPFFNLVHVYNKGRLSASWLIRAAGSAGSSRCWRLPSAAC